MMERSRGHLFSGTVFRYALGFSVVFILLQLAILFFTAQYSNSVQRQEAALHAKNVLRLCSDGIYQSTAKADSTLKYILTQDSYLRLLNSANGNDAYHAWYVMSEALGLISFPGSGVETYVISDRAGNLLLEKRSAGMSYGDMSALRDHLAEIGQSGHYTVSGWYPYRLNRKNYLIRYYIKGGATVMALIGLRDAWLEFQPVLNDAYTLIVESGAFGFAYDGGYREDVRAEDVSVDVAERIDSLQLTLSLSSVAGLAKANAPGPLAIFVSCILSLLGVATLVVYLRREFMQLKIDQYESIIRYQDAELKYYYMQIRPHFYLNALASMQRMCLRGENQRIGEYIMALSKNIRYMFSAGFRRIPLREETEHIDDYIRCQEILMPGCVFSYIEIAPEAGEWMIPQMILHTFVENVYKHVVTQDRLVTLLIRANVVREAQFGGEEVLRLLVEDDGDGFPQEVLDAFGSADLQAMKGCVGLLNVRRTLALMYGRDDLMRLKNNLSAGTRAIVFIPYGAALEGGTRDETAPRG